MIGSGRVLVSVVIPTRERVATLRHTLRTALAQVTTGYEVVVSDNFGQDGTREAVAALVDARLRYVNPGRRLSMRDNWEFALEHVSGDYVVYIGDDDGLMPGAIAALQRLIGATPSPIYAWQAHQYRWPSDRAPAALAFFARGGKPHEIDLRRRAAFACRWGGWRYYNLPLLYHAAVRRDLLESVRARTGRVFHAMAPDVFMAFALPVVSATALDVGRPLTVYGLSPDSNSGSAAAGRGDRVFDRFVQEYDDYRPHPAISPWLSRRAAVIADAALVAMNLFPEFYAGVRFDYDAMWAYAVRYVNDLSWWDVIARRESIAERHPFHVTRFLGFAVAQGALAAAGALRRFLRMPRLSPVPRDIAACAEALAALGRSGSASAEGCGEVPRSAGAA